MVVFEQLLEKARGYLPPDKLAFVQKAYEFASRAHNGQMRLSGDPYIEHPLQTAMILADLDIRKLREQREYIAGEYRPAVYSQALSR